MSAFLLGVGFRADMGTCARKLVLLKLIDACEDDGSRIFPAIATIARAAQCSARQVQRELLAFREVGLIRLVKEGGKGPRSTNEYAMDIDLLNRLGKEGWDVVTGESSGAVSDEQGEELKDGDHQKGDTMSPLAEPEKGDTGDTKRVTPATAKGDKLCHPTPPYPSREPSVEREARARERTEEPPIAEPDEAPVDDQRGEEQSAEGQPAEDQPAEDQPAEDQPGRAAFDKRVMRFCSGRGFLAGPWPDWDIGGSPDWIARQFAALSSTERREAERWRDAYLLDVADRRKAPIAPGNWLRGKVWTGLEPALLERAEKRRQGSLPPEERARPDGWAKFLGPVGMARFFALLIEGEGQGRRVSRLTPRADLQRQWPALLTFCDLLRQKGGAVFGPRWHALAGAMEPAPAGTELAARWKAEFEARGWLWLDEFDRLKVVFCPVSHGGDVAGAIARLDRRLKENEDVGRTDAA